MESEMVAVQESEVRYDISVARDPNKVIAEAMVAAKALKSIVSQKAKPVIFNKEQYIEFEDWQVLGRFYGVSAKIVSTEVINIDGVRGFLARAEAVDTNGRVVSAAEAMCLNDEDKWSTRTKYEYKDGERVKVGDVAVPLFQLRSMAQTRACAKALRNVLAWVVVMAGFRPNVAEEMTGSEGGDPGHKPIDPPRAKESTPGETISEAQAKRFFAIAKGAGKSNDDIKDYLGAKLNITRSSDIPRSAYDEACAWAASK